MTSAFINFQISQHPGIGTQRKAIAFKVPERHEAKVHTPAVEIPVYIKGGK